MCWSDRPTGNFSKLLVVTAGVRKYSRLFTISLYFTSICPIIAAQTKPYANGGMVTVGKRQVHVLVEGHGGPAVILEAGFVNDLRSFGKIQSDVAKLTMVVSYDRAGLGLSESTAGPRSGEQIAKDLHDLLTQLQIPPPYVLVGHSAGGLYVRSFAHLYRNEVAGMVFVDAVLPSYLKWLEKNDPEHWRQLTNIGMNSGEIVKAQWLGLEPTIAELRGRPLPGVPVAVLVSDEPDLPFKPPTAMPAFLRTQRQFARLIPHSRIEVIHAGHELPTLAPDRVLAAIDWVLKQADH